jgi:hypothetical protein
MTLHVVAGLFHQNCSQYDRTVDTMAGRFMSCYPTHSHDVWVYIQSPFIRTVHSDRTVDTMAKSADKITHYNVG